MKDKSLDDNLDMLFAKACQLKQLTPEGHEIAIQLGDDKPEETSNAKAFDDFFWNLDHPTKDPDELETMSFDDLAAFVIPAFLELLDGQYPLAS